MPCQVSEILARIGFDFPANVLAKGSLIGSSESLQKSFFTLLQAQTLRSCELATWHHPNFVLGVQSRHLVDRI